jgi:SAM-dependent methyltransferase
MDLSLSNDNNFVGDESKAESDSQRILPKNNRLYGTRHYWEERFAQEEEYEWLMHYHDVETILNRFLKPSDHILIVGCGNSSFSSDLYDAGYINITNVDYSHNVIHRMKKKHENCRPMMKWMVMDMTDMSAIDGGAFDVVIDKAAMDALVTLEGDVWNPRQEVVDACSSTCKHISRILKHGGYFLQLSFAQPHFRRKYLLGLRGPREDNDLAEYGWDLNVEKLDGREGCFQNYLYIMKKVTDYPTK